MVITEPVAELLETTDALTAYPMTNFTSVNGSLLVVFVHIRGSVAVGSLSGGGFVWSLLFYRYNPTANGFLACYYAQATSAASTTITYAPSDLLTTACLMCAFQITGHNAGSPIAQSAHDAVAAIPNPTVTLPGSMNTNNGYISVWAIGRTAPASAAPASWTETVDDGVANPIAGIAGAFRVGGETGSTITFTASSGSWTIGAVEINEELRIQAGYFTL